MLRYEAAKLDNRGTIVYYNRGTISYDNRGTICFNEANNRGTMQFHDYYGYKNINRCLTSIIINDNDVNIFPGYTSSGPWRSTFQPDFGVIIITHGLTGIGWKIYVYS